MKVVWLHGPPAAGKLTVAKVLHTDHAFKLFHNHLAVDISLAIYDEFGEKDFFSFTNSVRRQVLSKANSLGVMHLVMTYMTCAEKDDPQIKEYLTFFAQENIEVYPIHLRPGNDELLSRVTSAGRINTFKISSVSKLSELLLDQTRFQEKGLCFSSVCFDPDRVIDIFACFVPKYLSLSLRCMLKPR